MPSTKDGALRYSTILILLGRQRAWNHYHWKSALFRCLQRICLLKAGSRDCPLISVNLCLSVCTNKILDPKRSLVIHLVLFPPSTCSQTTASSAQFMVRILNSLLFSTIFSTIRPRVFCISAKFMSIFPCKSCPFLISTLPNWNQLWKFKSTEYRLLSIYFTIFRVFTLTFLTLVWYISSGLHARKFC